VHWPAIAFSVTRKSFHWVEHSFSTYLENHSFSTVKKISGRRTGMEKQIGILNVDLPDFLVKYSGMILPLFSGF